jgi:NAD(P)-dependent dehydrogenase (short-subunit alcohol dehydrogenase family)
MGLLEGRVAVVTGGAAGLGRAIVARFIAEGANVAVLDRNVAALDDLVAEFGARVVAVSGNVTDFASNVRVVDAAVERFDFVDVFVGNAGIYDNRSALADISGERLGAAFDELFAVDVKGYLLGAKAAHAQLRANAGTLIFTASISSFYPGYGGILYITAKHAVAGLTKQLALEFAPHVRVNAVAPGYIETGLAGLESLGQASSARPAPPAAESFPLGFVPQPDDYAGLYVSLASNAHGRMVTGQVLLADGAASIIH